DIYEHEGNIVLTAELPGVDPKEVDIRVENNILTLRGERKWSDDIQRESYHRVERAYGSFTRSFTLPNVVDTEKIKADYKDGQREPLAVKAGDKVLVGKWSGTDVTIDGTEYLIIKEDEILGILG